MQLNSRKLWVENLLHCRKSKTSLLTDEAFSVQLKSQSGRLRNFAYLATEYTANYSVMSLSNKWSKLLS